MEEFTRIRIFDTTLRDENSDPRGVADHLLRNDDRAGHRALPARPAGRRRALASAEEPALLPYGKWLDFPPLGRIGYNINRRIWKTSCIRWL